jgi:hypothetical protein
MKTKIPLILLVFAVALTFQGCFMNELGALVSLEFTVESGMIYPVFVVTPPAQLRGTTYEIPSGNYDVSGQVNPPKTDAMGDGFFCPSKITFLVKKQKSIADGSDDLKAKVQTITINLAVDPLTGVINEQTVAIKKAMIVDSAKNEFFDIYLKIEGGVLDRGTAIKLNFAKQ